MHAQIVAEQSLMALNILNLEQKEASLRVMDPRALAVSLVNIGLKCNWCARACMTDAGVTTWWILRHDA